MANNWSTPQYPDDNVPSFFQEDGVTLKTATHWVDHTNGSNTLPGGGWNTYGDAARPWQTLDFAITRAPVGAVVYVKAGSWSESNIALGHRTSVGTESQPILFIAEDGPGSVTIVGPGLTKAVFQADLNSTSKGVQWFGMYGFNLDCNNGSGGIVMPPNSSHVHFQEIEIYNSNGTAIDNRGYGKTDNAAQECDHLWEDIYIHDTKDGFRNGVKDTSGQNRLCLRNVKVIARTPYVDGNYDGIVLENQNRNAIIEDCEAAGFPDAQFDVKPSGVLIQRCKAHSAANSPSGKARTGFKIWGWNNPQLINCIAWDCPGYGVEIASKSGAFNSSDKPCLLDHCVFVYCGYGVYNQSGVGPPPYASNPNAWWNWRMRNCIFYEAPLRAPIGWAFGQTDMNGDPDYRDWGVANCAFYRASGSALGFYDNQTTGTSYTQTEMQTLDNAAQNLLFSDPMFTNLGDWTGYTHDASTALNPVTFDWTIQETSPCRQAGVTYGPIATDFAEANYAEPPVIGCYEYDEADPPPDPPVEPGYRGGDRYQIYIPGWTNPGTEAAYGITAVLTDDSNNIEIPGSTVAVPVIASGETVSLGPFLAKAKAAASGDVTLTLTVTPLNGNVVTKTTTIAFESVTGLTVPLTAAFTVTGTLAAGGTADVELELTNGDSVDAVNVEASLSAAGTGVSVTNSSTSYGTIAAGATESGANNFTLVFSSAASGTVTLTATITANNADDATATEEIEVAAVATMDADLTQTGDWTITKL